MDKRGLSESDICAKFITPHVRAAGWDEMSQIRREVFFNKDLTSACSKRILRGKVKPPPAYTSPKNQNHSIAIVEGSHGEI